VSGFSGAGVPLFELHAPAPMTARKPTEPTAHVKAMSDFIKAS
jgi:hypothetical protein